ncbi:MAG: sigma-54-dependent Fis family transcriptional regulator [Gemmatimonadetes bacterium]|nr:sigma-54-dependent Fis family transcriptional regulator [Gemmatimonadota bacterium]
MDPRRILYLTAASPDDGATASGTEGMLPAITSAGWRVHVAPDIRSASGLLEEYSFGVGMVRLDPALGGQFRGDMDVLCRAVGYMPWVALLSRDARDNEEICRFVWESFYDYHTLPPDVDRLLATLGHAHGMAMIGRTAPNPAHGAVAEPQIVAVCAPMQAVFQSIRKIAAVDATVLITGESGTGKELVARAIHRASTRSERSFVRVNCGALAEGVLESELFGHERGAFTDATSTKPGLFEVADGGTIFLDEIGDLPLELQAKFLRVLQDKQVRRVGGTKSRKVDIRIIAATNEDLSRHIQDGKFREDLYFRLSVITLTLPPLRERGDDLMLIVDALLKELAEHHDLPVPDITPQARRSLLDYHWPGNVRELRNAVERALLLSAPGELDPRELRPQSETIARQGGPIPFPARLDDITVAAANAMLGLANGNRSEAARRLGISRRRLRRLLEGGRGEL